jgi:DNA-binding CsgD family transcriptional regulator
MKRPSSRKRQAQVVERVARGLPDKQIAAELGISIYTVHTHIEHRREDPRRNAAASPPAALLLNVETDAA